MTQVCNCCGKEKPISEYEWLKNRPNPRKTCKECRYMKRDIKKENDLAKQRKAGWHEKNKDRKRRNWERSKYGVCKEDLSIDKCLICGSTHRLCIDHCHESGKVRGILCTQCNTGLGMFKDDIDRLLSAIEYLKTNEK